MSDAFDHYSRPPALDDVAVIAPRVVRILGQNPGKYTLEGTNTYLLLAPAAAATQTAVPAVLVDTGQGMDAYTKLLARVIRGMSTEDGRRIHASYVSDIILTHWHDDHVNGLAAVLLLNRELNPDAPPPRIHKFPNDRTDPGLVQREIHPLSPLSAFVSLPAQGTASSHGTFYPLRHQEPALLSASFDDAGGGTVRVLHTPGHTVDHTCLIFSAQDAEMKETQATQETQEVYKTYFFAGDHILGAGTTVFEDLHAYMESLKLCEHELLHLPLTGESQVLLLPGHGPVAPDALAKVREYILHRQRREEEIVDLVRSPGSRGSAKPWSLQDIVQTLYASYPPSLWGAAGRGVFLHLIRLLHPDTATTATYGGHVVALNDITHLIPILQSLGEPPSASSSAEGKEGGQEQHVLTQAELERLARQRAEQRDQIFAQLMNTQWVWRSSSSSSSPLSH